MKMILAILLLVPVAVIKVILILLGLVIVPFAFWRGKALPDMYRIGINRPYTVWEAMIRNPVGGFGWLLEHPEPEQVRTYGEVLEPSNIIKPLQARFRHAGLFCSIRLLWQYPGYKHYGELYLGWKLLSAPPELDFALSARFWATVGN